VVKTTNLVELSSPNP